jgi:hypothetical protein
MFPRPAVTIHKIKFRQEEGLLSQRQSGPHSVTAADMICADPSFIISDLYK